MKENKSNIKFILYIIIAILIVIVITFFAVFHILKNINNNAPCLNDEAEVRTYFYKSNEDFDNIVEYDNYVKQSLFIHNDEKMLLINNVEDLNHALKSESILEYLKTSKYDNDFFQNNSLVIYVYNNNSNITDVKANVIYDNNTTIDINIAEGKIITDEKDRDEKLINLPEKTYLLAISINKIMQENDLKINKHYYDVSLDYIDEMIKLDKPVIYIYPERETEVEIELLNKDKLLVTYPLYENKWQVTAYPDGTLIDKNNQKYYALYYESQNLLNNNLNKEEGFIVSKDNIINFLEEKLEILGLNYKEREEFIIYWLPKLNKYNYVYIRFQNQEEINKNMPLKIKPNPDTLIRIVMEWQGLDKKITVKKQKLEKEIRKGYTVIEWGGTELKY